MNKLLLISFFINLNLTFTVVYKNKTFTFNGDGDNKKAVARKPKVWLIRVAQKYTLTTGSGHDDTEFNVALNSEYIVPVNDETKQYNVVVEKTGTSIKYETKDSNMEF